MTNNTFLTGKMAVVTGGGRGIGKAIAMRLACLGATVVLAGTKAASLEAAVDEIKAAGGDARAVVTDVAREYDVLNLFARAGNVDILVNNAGIGWWGNLVDMTVEEWDRVLGVNLRGAFLCSREAMRSMRGRGGRIINISSVVGIKAYAGQGAYSASKQGLMGLSQAMALEGQKDNIITQVIAPGGVHTDLIGDARPDMDFSSMMRPEDVADAVEFLLRQEGNAVTDLIRLRRRTNTPW